MKYQNKDFFERFIIEGEKAGDMQLSYQLHTAMRNERNRNLQQLAQMKEEIINEVMERISVKLDADGAITEIKSLQAEFKKLEAIFH